MHLLNNSNDLLISRSEVLRQLCTLEERRQSLGKSQATGAQRGASLTPSPPWSMEERIVRPSTPSAPLDPVAPAAGRRQRSTWSALRWGSPPGSLWRRLSRHTPVAPSARGSPTRTSGTSASSRLRNWRSRDMDLAKSWTIITNIPLVHLKLMMCLLFFCTFLCVPIII